MNYKFEYIILASHYATYGAYIGDVCISDGAAALSGGAAGVWNGCCCCTSSSDDDLVGSGGNWCWRLWLHLQQVPHDLHATHGGQILPTAHRCPQDIMVPSIIYSGLHVQLHSSCSFPHVGHCCSPSSMPLRRIALSIVASTFSANWSSACSMPMHVV